MIYHPIPLGMCGERMEERIEYVRVIVAKAMVKAI